MKEGYLTLDNQVTAEIQFTEGSEDDYRIQQQSVDNRKRETPRMPANIPSSVRSSESGGTKKGAPKRHNFKAVPDGARKGARNVMETLESQVS